MPPLTTRMRPLWHTRVLDGRSWLEPSPPSEPSCCPQRRLRTTSRCCATWQRPSIATPQRCAMPFGRSGRFTARSEPQLLQRPPQIQSATCSMLPSLWHRARWGERGPLLRGRALLSMKDKSALWLCRRWPPSSVFSPPSSLPSAGPAQRHPRKISFRQSVPSALCTQFW